MKFTVNGIPRPLKRHRHTRNGRTYDPSVKDKQSFATQAALKRPGEPLNGALRLKLIFYMPRPKNHYRTGKYAHLLKEASPHYHTSAPDTSNLIKLVEDALNGMYWTDDRQIAQVEAEKRYCKPDSHPKTDVQIEILPV